MIVRLYDLRRGGRFPGALAAMALLFGAGLAQAAPDEGAPAAGAAMVTAEKPYLDENAAAMDRMMAGMEVKPTGDVDRDFVAMMTPHHQGAIDMAQAYLRHGRNEQLRRVAQEIIVEQQQEIAAMALAIGAPLPAQAPAPTGAAPAPAAATSPAMPSAAAHHHHMTSNP
jgi:hypothetical protein